MAQAIEFLIERSGDLWRLTRDGHDDGKYSHVDQATHDAVNRARELKDAGSPAKVFVVVKEDQRIEIDTDPEAPNPDLANNAEAFTRTAPL